MWLWPEGQKMLACPLQCCCTQMGHMNGPEVRILLSGGCPPLPCERDCPVDAWKCLLSFICLCYSFVNRYFGSNLCGGRCTQCYSRVNLIFTSMAPHSSTLAWKRPWTEEPGRLRSMGSLRVRHD